MPFFRCTCSIYIPLGPNFPRVRVYIYGTTIWLIIIIHWIESSLEYTPSLYRDLMDSWHSSIVLISKSPQLLTVLSSILYVFDGELSFSEGLYIYIYISYINCVRSYRSRFFLNRSSESGDK